MTKVSGELGESKIQVSTVRLPEPPSETAQDDDMSIDDELEGLMEGMESEKSCFED